MVHQMTIENSRKSFCATVSLWKTALLHPICWNGHPLVLATRDVTHRYRRQPLPDRFFSRAGATQHRKLATGLQDPWHHRQDFSLWPKLEQREILKQRCRWSRLWLNLSDISWQPNGGGRKACMKLSLQGTWESRYKRECALPATDSVQSVASWGLQYVSPCEKQNHQLRTQSICNKLIVIFIKHNKKQTIDHNHMRIQMNFSDFKHLQTVCSDNWWSFEWHTGSLQPLGVRQWLQASSQLRTGERTFCCKVLIWSPRWCQSCTWLTWWKMWSTRYQRSCRPPKRLVAAFRFLFSCVAL